MMNLIIPAYLTFILPLLIITVLSSEPTLITAGTTKCQEKCGRISIPFPFGMGSNCSFDDRYAIICDTSLSPPKPFLQIANNYLEVLEISLKDSTLRVNSPVFSNCPKKARTWPLNLSGSPFAFSSAANKFVSLGCDNTAFLKTEQKKMISGCMSYCVNTNRSLSSSLSRCHGQECCQTRIPWPLDFVNVSFKKAGSGGYKRPKDGCTYALIAEGRWIDYSLDRNVFAISKEDKFVPAVLEWTMYNNGTCAISNDQIINEYSLGSAALCAPTNAHCSPRSNDQSFVCSCHEGYEGNPYVECKGN